PTRRSSDLVALGALLAVLLLLFQPAIRMIAIKTTTAMPAIQPHMPPDVSGRRSTGSLSRGSKRGSDMASSLVVRTSPLVRENGPRPSTGKPAGDIGVPKKPGMHRGNAELQRRAVKMA